MNQKKPILHRHQHRKIHNFGTLNLRRRPRLGSEDTDSRIFSKLFKLKN